MLRWARRRAAPLLVTAVVMGTAFAFSLWWNLHVDHNTVWYEPADLWRTMLAAVRLDHGQLGQLYSDGTNLVSFPGAAVILAPAAALISAIHAPLGPPIGSVTDTNAWLIALPYTVAISCSVLFAADRLAERMGVRTGKRMALAAAGGVALWNVVPYWGHPEDCVAVALLLFAVDAAAAGRPWRSAWLVGLGLAVQPLVMLAVPILAVVSGRRQIVGWLARAAVPPAVALGAALATNWSATWYQVVDQPNWPYIDRPTPWIALAPHLTTQTVAAGPGRSIAVVLAVVACWPAWRAWQRVGGDGSVPAADQVPVGGEGSAMSSSSTDDVAPTEATPAPASLGLQSVPLRASGAMHDPDPSAARHARAGEGWALPWPPAATATVVWWVAVALALRCGFESVMVSYYIWPAIAIGMLAAVTSWWRLVPAAALGIGLTAFCNVWWHGEWPWWSVIVVTLALLLTAAYPSTAFGRQARAGGTTTSSSSEEEGRNGIPEPTALGVMHGAGDVSPLPPLPPLLPWPATGPGTTTSPGGGGNPA